MGETPSEQNSEDLFDLDDENENECIDLSDEWFGESASESACRRWVNDRRSRFSGRQILSALALAIITLSGVVMAAVFTAWVSNPPAFSLEASEKSQQTVTVLPAELAEASGDQAPIEDAGPIGLPESLEDASGEETVEQEIHAPAPPATVVELPECDWFDVRSGFPAMVTSQSLLAGGNASQMNFLVVCKRTVYAAELSQPLPDGSWVHRNLRVFKGGKRRVPEAVRTPGYSAVN